MSFKVLPTSLMIDYHRISLITMFCEKKAGDIMEGPLAILAVGAMLIVAVLGIGLAYYAILATQRSRPPDTGDSTLDVTNPLRTTFWIILVLSVLVVTVFSLSMGESIEDIRKFFTFLMDIMPSL